MCKEIFQLFFEKIEEKSWTTLISKAVKQFGKDATFKSLREFYLQEHIDIYQKLTSPELSKESFHREFFLLRDFVKELVPFTKIEHTNSLLNCLNFYLFNCLPGELTLSFVLNNLPEWLKKNHEALNTSLNILENDEQTNFHCLIIEKIFSTLCLVNQKEGKEKIFSFLERTREHELVGAIVALNSLKGYDSEIVQKMHYLMQKNSSDWVITNIVLVLLRLCKRNRTLIKDISDICGNLLDKNHQLVICLVVHADEFMELGKDFDLLLSNAVKYLEHTDEMALCCLDSSLLKCLQSEGKISFVLGIFSELLVKKQELSNHLHMTLKLIRENPSYLAQALMFFLSKPAPQFWRICTHITNNTHNDLGMDLLFLRSELIVELEKIKLPITKLINRIVYGMFLVPRSVLSLFLIIYQWIQLPEDAFQALKILYSPFAINYSSFCLFFFKKGYVELSNEKKRILESFLSELKDLNEHLKNARTELQTLRLTEKESLLVREFENARAKNIYQQSLEQSIFNKLGIHREVILYGRGVLYYQRTPDGKMINRSSTKIASFSTSINWPLMSLLCPSVLEHILIIKAMEGQE